MASSGGARARGLAWSSLTGLRRAGKAEPATLPGGATQQRTRRGWLVRRMLVAADISGLLAALIATELLFPQHRFGPGRGIEALVFVLAMPVWIVAAKLYGLYDKDEERATHSTADEVSNVFHLMTVAVWLFFAGSWLVGLAGPHQKKLAMFWLLAFLAVITGRLAARALARRLPAYVQNVVIIGAGDVGQLVGRKLIQHPEYRINFLGYVDAAPKKLRADLQGVKLLGEPDEIIDIVRQHGVDRVIVAFSHDRHEELLRLIGELRMHDVQIDVVPRLFEAVSANTSVHGVEGLSLLSLTPVRIPRSSRLLKRMVDIAGASLLCALTAPLMVVIAVLIRLDSPGPVFFRQIRLGLNMREFKLFKFRTMREDTDEAQHRDYVRKIMSVDALPGSNNLYKLERRDAVTRVGAWLRRTSLDELPQLLNVIRGDMSLVGPRPLIPYELKLFAPHHFERFLVPAGLTGLWQVEARAHSTFGEALDMDSAYARGWSLGLDLRLLLRTPLVMFRKGETV
jgi:exopolysaccharide biosynthesis polyprenyl glycosylphosphotransferase